MREGGVVGVTCISRVLSPRAWRGSVPTVGICSGPGRHQGRVQLVVSRSHSSTSSSTTSLWLLGLSQVIWQWEVVSKVRRAMSDGSYLDMTLLALSVPPVIYTPARKSSTLWSERLPTRVTDCLRQTKYFHQDYWFPIFVPSVGLETRWGNHKCQASQSVLMLETNIESLTMSLALSPPTVLH